MLDAALDLPGADGVEVLMIHEWGGLTRFANVRDPSEHVARGHRAARARGVSDGRLGVAATNDFTRRRRGAAAASALELARVAVPDPQFPGLAPPAEVAAVRRVRRGHGDMSPEARAEAVATLIGQVGHGFRAAGAFETTAAEIALANTEGQFCYAPTTQATITTVVSGGDGGAGTPRRSPAARRTSTPSAIGRRAFQKALATASGRTTSTPAAYEVVLEPLAVSTLVAFLSFMAFGGRAIEEGRSASAARPGQQSPRPTSPSSTTPRPAARSALPFDFEGTPRQRVALIEHGVFRSACTTAGARGTPGGSPPGTRSLRRTPMARSR